MLVCSHDELELGRHTLPTRSRHYTKLCLNPKERNYISSSKLACFLHRSTQYFNLDFSCRLGSGTGIFTRALLADPVFGPAVGELRAVEPSEGMRTTFQKKLNDPRVSTYEGTFDHTGVEDGWADIVIVAQVSWDLGVLYYIGTHSRRTKQNILVLPNRHGTGARIIVAQWFALQ